MPAVNARPPFYSVIETAKLNGIEPQAYITDVIEKAASGWPAARWDGAHGVELAARIGGSQACCVKSLQWLAMIPQGVLILIYEEA